jgi:hypothetical protein
LVCDSRHMYMGVRKLATDTDSPSVTNTRGASGPSNTRGPSGPCNLRFIHLCLREGAVCTLSATNPDHTARNPKVAVPTPRLRFPRTFPRSPAFPRS